MKKDTIKIEVIYSEQCLYKVVVNDVTLLECLGEDEVNELTIGEIQQLMWTYQD